MNISRLAHGMAATLMVVATAAISTPVVRGQDFGDHKSSTLTSKAWEALGAGKYDTAAAYVSKCRELYGSKALEQQKALDDFLPTEKGHDAWALNDVGTCTFIEGQLLEKQGKTKEAIAAYGRLVRELKYSQCWDPKGWFWRPAESAAMRIKQLDFDAALDAK